MTEKLLYSVADCSDALAISRSVIYELMASGELESITVGRSRRVPIEALRDFIRRRQAASGHALAPAA